MGGGLQRRIGRTLPGGGAVVPWLLGEPERYKGTDSRLQRLAARAGGKKVVFVFAFCIKNDRFTKTGSGQT